MIKAIEKPQRLRVLGESRRSRVRWWWWRQGMRVKCFYWWHSGRVAGWLSRFR